jgi:CHAT domain-containing protein
MSLVDRDGHARNGFVHAYELYKLKLSAALVVLSACQTALGEQIRGEGLISLTRPFMYAGAPRIVASLWQVPDRATAELMTLFYRAIFRDHLSPAAALRHAQLTLQRSPRWSSPYFWAGFTLQGDWR